MELSDSGFIMLRDKLQKVIDVEKDPRQQLLQLCAIHWEFALEHKELYDLMFNGSHIVHGTNQRRPFGTQPGLGIEMVNNIFTGLTGSGDFQHLLINWICLRRGSIELLTQNDDVFSELDRRSLYMEFMERFISSIEKKT